MFVACFLQRYVYKSNQNATIIIDISISYSRRKKEEGRRKSLALSEF
ncbi:MAG: hypothetical protein F6K17_18815 [Okeania sp. SIO3C4]|nr:hypothetical protein [Okeania sp. SIO3C4]